MGHVWERCETLLTGKMGLGSAEDDSIISNKELTVWEEEDNNKINQDQW